ncbi:hypothetical protein LTR62_001869 [Meristemomyces frigidus]|uniref:Uncharacterized protein n=1 Tax=Meristemomyces frigidus TaxID=1508187 RepID=A0AAN7T8Y1_9PEZI|nr:hypothetical protein LTR62_001869 [Meristemomyces frigidus]
MGGLERPFTALFAGQVVLDPEPVAVGLAAAAEEEEGETITVERVVGEAVSAFWLTVAVNVVYASEDAEDTEPWALLIERVIMLTGA